jgi:hypothetical protein
LGELVASGVDVAKVAVALGKSRDAALPAIIEKIEKQFGDDP